jgi:hypothetical protein
MRTVDQAIRAASRNPQTPQAKCFSVWRLTVKPRRGKVRRGQYHKNLTTTTASGYTNAYDWLAKAMGLGPSSTFATASGFATSTTSTTLVNTGAAFPTAGQALAGQVVVAGPNNAGAGSFVYGVIVSNTATTLTVDQWTSFTSTTGSAGSTPNGTCSYGIVQGQNPASWMAVTANTFSPATSDTTLAGELTTNGFARAPGTWSHTAAASTYQLVHLWTATGTETINNEAQFGAANPTAGGVMPFESAEPNPPTLVSGDTLQNTVTITI